MSSSAKPFDPENPDFIEVAFSGEKECRIQLIALPKSVDARCEAGSTINSGAFDFAERQN